MVHGVAVVVEVYVGVCEVWVDVSVLKQGGEAGSATLIGGCHALWERCVVWVMSGVLGLSCGLVVSCVGWVCDDDARVLTESGLVLVGCDVEGLGGWGARPDRP